MKINADKPKIMRFTKPSNKEVKIKIENETIESVSEFRCLGSLFTMTETSKKLKPKLQ